MGVCNKTAVSKVKSATFYKSVQLVGYGLDVNIIVRMKRAVIEVYEELKETAKEEGLNIRVEKNSIKWVNKKNM